MIIRTAQVTLLISADFEPDREVTFKIDQPTDAQQSMLMQAWSDWAAKQPKPKVTDIFGLM